MQVWGIFSLVFTDSRFRAWLWHQGEAECMVITIEDTVLYQQTTWWCCQLDTHCVKTGAFVCELTQCLAKTRWKYFWWKNTGARCAIRLKDRQLLLILRMSHRQFGEKKIELRKVFARKKIFYLILCLYFAHLLVFPVLHPFIPFKDISQGSWRVPCDSKSRRIGVLKDSEEWLKTKVFQSPLQERTLRIV